MSQLFIQLGYCLYTFMFYPSLLLHFYCLILTFMLLLFQLYHVSSFHFCFRSLSCVSNFRSLPFLMCVCSSFLHFYTICSLIHFSFLQIFISFSIISTLVILKNDTYKIKCSQKNLFGSLVKLNCCKKKLDFALIERILR